MKNKLKSWLEEYKEKTGKEYIYLRYPKPFGTPTNLLKLVANIKIAETTIRRNEIVEEKKINEKLNDVDISTVDCDIALWQPYVKL